MFGFDTTQLPINSDWTAIATGADYLVFQSTGMIAVRAADTPPDNADFNGLTVSQSDGIQSMDLKALGNKNLYVRNLMPRVVGVSAQVKASTL